MLPNRNQLADEDSGSRQGKESRTGSTDALRATNRETSAGEYGAEAETEILYVLGYLGYSEYRQVPEVFVDAMNGWVWLQWSLGKNCWGMICVLFKQPATLDKGVLNGQCLFADHA